jgi:hypothetical protein
VSNSLFLVSYVEGCASGAIRLNECGPVWQLGVIGGLLVLAIVLLCVLRLKASVSKQESQAVTA